MRDFGLPKLSTIMKHMLLLYKALDDFESEFHDVILEVILVKVKLSPCLIKYVEEHRCDS
jgi:hypothetical protein